VHLEVFVLQSAPARCNDVSGMLLCRERQFEGLDRAAVILLMPFHQVFIQHQTNLGILSKGVLHHS
jgi:hypothetical protein